MNSYLVGLAVEPVFRNPKSGEVFPSVVGTMRRGIELVAQARVLHVHPSPRESPAGPL